MKFKFLLGTLLMTLLILGSHAVSRVMAQTPDDPGLRLLSADDQAIELELTVTDFEVETLAHEGQTYQRIIIPAMVQTHVAGEPQVPLQGTMVGLPSLSGISIEIIDSDYETLAGSYRLYPNPRLSVIGDDVAEASVEEVFALDQALYATDALYPGQPVKVGETGMMRDQAVASVQFYPVQYNPVSGEVRLYRRILARITWDDDVSLLASETRLASPDYEQVLRNTLLNYATLRRPPLASGAPAPGQSGDEEIGVTDTTPRLKIGVTEDAIYKLTPTDLTGNGFSLSGVNLSTIKIYNRGTQIRLYEYDGNSNNQFDGSDYILFYGVAITDIYTTKNIYWLEAGGADGLRMNARDGTGSTSFPLAQYFPATLHLEENSRFRPTLPNQTGYDYWFWGGVQTAPGNEDFSFDLYNISTIATTATVRARLKGWTDVGTIPDHHTRIYLNDFGTAIDDQYWDGQIVFDHAETVNPSNLTNGSNTVRIQGVGDTGASVDQFFIDWIEIDYWDTYVAEDDKLFFKAPAGGNYKFEVTGFSSNEIQLFDITDPTQVEMITGTVAADGGNYKLQFKDSALAQTRYLALTPGQREAPDSIELDQPPAFDLKSSQNQADYLIITHEDFLDNVSPLATHRSSPAGGGYAVKTVNVEEIYDAFSYGIFTPQAIRDFLDYTFDSWQDPAPAYVVLVGDATNDYKDYYGLGTINYVPTQLVDTTTVGLAASDLWFVLLNGSDDIPDMFIGRLSAQTESQVDDIVVKIINYELFPPVAPWNKNVLLIADHDDSYDFEGTSDEVAAKITAEYTVNKVYVRDYPGDPTVGIATYINDGSLVVNYVGHGDITRWGYASIFWDVDDVNDLNNVSKLPVATLGNCLNGAFSHPSASVPVALAEAFQRRPSRGAVAVWAATSWSYASAHHMLLTSFYDAVFQQYEYRLGQATKQASIVALNAGWNDQVKTFVFFGDPATQLGGGSSPGPGSGRVYLPIVIKGN